MKKWTKVYLQYFYPDDWDVEGMWRECEICGGRMVDVHHIESRGMGGSKERDEIDNLMGLCRSDHEKYGDKKEWVEWLKERHKEFKERMGRG